jgi:hypothetical protein
MAQLNEEQTLALEEVQAEWRTRGQPSELQRKTVERNGHNYLERSAEVQYKEMGMRSIVWEFHERKSGIKMFQLWVQPIT